MKFTLFFVLIFFFQDQILAQRFIAGFVLGLNASQIEGDQLAGYDKLGMTGGIKGGATISEKFIFNLEFLYSQRGSRPDIFSATLDPNIKIKLQYIELPVYISYKDWLKEEGYYKVQVNAGLSYGRLMKAQTFDHFNEAEENLDTMVDLFSENDLSATAGFTFMANHRLGFAFRYTRSVTPLLNAKKQDLPIPSLYPFFLTFRAEYLL